MSQHLVNHDFIRDEDGFGIVLHEFVDVVSREMVRMLMSEQQQIDAIKGGNPSDHLAENFFGGR